MFFDETLRRLKMLFQGSKFQNDLEEEMQLHLELRQQKHLEAGLSPAASRSAAYRNFGSITSIKETSYKAWGWNWLESFLQDLRYGVRSMFRSPRLTLVALLSLVLGIGANTTIFSFLEPVMLRSLPVKDPAQVVLLGEGDEQGIP